MLDGRILARLNGSSVRETRASIGTFMARDRAAESFTASPAGRWQNDPLYAQKLGDLMVIARV